jgi:hypothetical protein
MRTPSVVLTCLLFAACSQPANTPAPAPKAAPAAEPAPAKVAAAEPAKPAKPDDEDGCIYKDANTPHDAECPSHDAMPPSATPGHFGAEFALKDPKPLSSVLAAANDQKAPILVSGTVDSVCQKKGCWLVVKDGEAQARIMMKDHAFTAPMDCKGKNVVVEGTLEARTFNEAQVKHLEKDAGKDPAAVTGERVEYVLTATGMELKS